MFALYMIFMTIFVEVVSFAAITAGLITCVLSLIFGKKHS
jgi:hypothetical protein